MILFSDTFSFLAATSLDSALVVNLKQGVYTVQISGKNENTGNVLAEVYDMTPSGMYIPDGVMS